MSNRKEIHEKFEAILKEAGINRRDLYIYAAIADGACESNTTALHYHRDQELGQYVRINIDDFLVKCWPFF